VIRIHLINLLLLALAIAGFIWAEVAYVVCGIVALSGLFVPLIDFGPTDKPDEY